MIRFLFRGVLVLALAASACGKASPTAPTPDASTPGAQTVTRVVSLGGNLAFGSVEIGKTAESTLTIGNGGTATLSVTGITAPEAYTLSWTNGTIAPGGSQQITVRFAPATARSYQGTVVVNGDQTGGTNTAPVSGTGTASALSAIAGTVTEKGAGPLGGVNIEIRDGPDAKRTTTTDAEGRFSLAGLQPGSVTVRAWKSGYSDTDQGAALAAGGVVTLAFSMPKAAAPSGSTAPSTPPSTPRTPSPPSTPSTPSPPTTPSPPSTPGTPAPASSPTAYDTQILGLINDYRRSIGKPALAMNQVIWQQASGHSQNMASGAVLFGHDGFEARISAIIAALGGGGYGAENVAMGFNSAAAVVNAWLGSAGHRANIEGNATRTGIAAVQSRTGTWYYTQIFY